MSLSGHYLLPPSDGTIPGLSGRPGGGTLLRAPPFPNHYTQMRDSIVFIRLDIIYSNAFCLFKK